MAFVIFGLSGLAAGFFAGLFGIGGGLIMVPALVYAFTAAGVDAQHVVAMARGTSMAAIVFSTAQSAYSHYRHGSASTPTVRRAAPWAMVGVTLGSLVAGETSHVALLFFVGCFQFIAAALMLADISKYAVVQTIARQDTALNVCSVAFGGVAGLAGIGGGTLFTPYFAAGGMEPKRAVGTSAAMALPVSLVGAFAYALGGRGAPLGHWTIGYIHLPALAALVIGTLATVRLGVAVAHRLPPRVLAAAFAAFLVLNGVHLLFFASREALDEHQGPPIEQALGCPICAAQTWPLRKASPSVRTTAPRVRSQSSSSAPSIRRTVTLRSSAVTSPPVLKP